MNPKVLLLTNSFKNFVKTFWHCVCVDPLIWGKHLDALCEHLQAIRDGKIQNLLINLPPRCSKSIICSVLFPVWLWLSDPTERILSASYGSDLSTEHARLSKDLVQHSAFRALFPHIAISEAVKAQDHYENTLGGKRRAVSVGSATTGFSASIIIVDDLHKIKTRESESDRKTAIDYYGRDLSSRRIFGKPVPKIVIGQRVHQSDVSGFIIEHFADDPAWSFLVLPMEYQEGREELPNSLGFKDWRTEVGELLWPEAITRNDLRQLKIETARDYPCLFNQDVVNREGDIFKADWFRYYSADDKLYYLNDHKTGLTRVVRKDQCVRIASVDMAATTGADSDYTVCVVADCFGGDIIVTHVYRRKLNGTQIVPVLRGLFDTFQPHFMAVENSGQFGVLIDQLRAAGVVVRKMRPEGNKEVRVIPVAVKCEQGQLRFPTGAEWLGDFEAELLAFPRARHDDQTDALAYLGICAARWDRGEHGGEGEPVAVSKGEAEEARKADIAERLRLRREGILKAGSLYGTTF